MPNLLSIHAAVKLHANKHENGGVDEISVAGLSGLLADEQNAGKIKGVAINDEDIGDQKVLAFDLASESIQYITQAPSGAVIKSIQQGSITFTNTGDTATINEVDMNKSVLIYGGHITGQAGLTRHGCRLVLTDSTTVTAYMDGNFATVVVRFTVLEFDSGIKSIQRGITTLVGLGVTFIDVTISSVDLTKSWVNYLGHTRNLSHLYNILTNAYLVNETTLRISVNTGPEYGVTTSWEIIEFE